MTHPHFPGKSCICRFLFFLVSILAFNAGPSFAETISQPTPAKPASVKRGSSRSYCGLYCLFAVMKATGQNVNFRELLKPDYIGSKKGSSLLELKKAAEDNGLYAEMVGKLTIRQLRQSPYTIILHTKSAAGNNYDHYKLFLGTKDGHAKLFDPPEPIKLVPFHEIAPRWDGNGLVLSATPIDIGSLFAQSRKQFIMYAAVMTGIILMVHWGRRQWLQSGRVVSSHQLLGFSLAQGIGLVVISLVFGMIYHFANDAGFLANANATASIQQAHAGNFIPKISERKVQKLLDSDTVFIDARFARDYKAGHLKGALSIPVDGNDVERQEATADIPKDSRIVMYCQSSRCKYAEIVAIKLKDDGFSNISVFKGGWVEWIANNGKPKESTI